MTRPVNPMPVHDAGADLGLKATAAATGVSTQLLSAWEHRYRWPTPRRTPGGTKFFSPALIALIRMVKTHRDSGVPIGSIIRADGPVLPRIIPKSTPVITPVQRCVTSNGCEAQTAVLKARSSGMPMDQLRALAEKLSVRVRPNDRAGVYACVPKD